MRDRDKASYPRTYRQALGLRAVQLRVLGEFTRRRVDDTEQVVASRVFAANSNRTRVRLPRNVLTNSDEAVLSKS